MKYLYKIFFISLILILAIFVLNFISDSIQVKKMKLDALNNFFTKKISLAQTSPFVLADQSKVDIIFNEITQDIRPIISGTAETYGTIENPGDGFPWGWTERKFEPQRSNTCPDGSTSVDGKCGGGTPNNPKGYLDGADCSFFTGWTCDPDDYNTPLDVHFYKDNQRNPEDFIDTVNANQTRESAVGEQCGGKKEHGFTYTIPNFLKDGVLHSIYAYGINIGEGNHQLLKNSATNDYSPKTIKCGNKGNLKVTLNDVDWRGGITLSTKEPYVSEAAIIQFSFNKSTYNINDTWKLTANSNLSNKSVLHCAKELNADNTVKKDYGCSKPSERGYKNASGNIASDSTDSNGAWSAQGTITNDLANTKWEEWIKIDNIESDHVFASIDPAITTGSNTSNKTITVKECYGIGTATDNKSSCSYNHSYSMPFDDNLVSGKYEITAVSGGPAGATLQTNLPYSQTLTSGGALGFNLAFKSPDPDVSFTAPNIASNSTVNMGDKFDLNWKIDNYEEACPSGYGTCSATAGGSTKGGWPTGNVATNGSVPIDTTDMKRGETYTYQLTVTGANGNSKTEKIQVSVGKGSGGSGSSGSSGSSGGGGGGGGGMEVYQIPQCQFTAYPPSITLPETSTLNWKCDQFKDGTYSANSCSINQGVGQACSSGPECTIGGSKEVRPTQNTTYTLSCNGPDGSRSFVDSIQIKSPFKVQYQEINPAGN